MAVRDIDINAPSLFQISKVRAVKTRIIEIVGKMEAFAGRQVPAVTLPDGQLELVVNALSRDGAAAILQPPPKQNKLTRDAMIDAIWAAVVRGEIKIRLGDRVLAERNLRARAS